MEGDRVVVIGQSVSKPRISLRWSQMVSSLHVQHLYISHLFRRVILFPKGNISGPGSEWVSVYLNCASNSGDACAQFVLALSSPSDPTIFLARRKMAAMQVGSRCSPICSDTRHRFVPGNHPCGFTKFSRVEDLLQPTKSHGGLIIENESTMVTVFLRVFKDPTGLLWKYSSLYVCHFSPLIIGTEKRGRKARKAPTVQKSQLLGVQVAYNYRIAFNLF